MYFQKKKNLTVQLAPTRIKHFFFKSWPPQPFGDDVPGDLPRARLRAQGQGHGQPRPLDLDEVPLVVGDGGGGVDGGGAGAEVDGQLAPVCFFERNL